MAKTKQQYEIFTVMVEDASFRKGKMTLDLRDVTMQQEQLMNGTIKKTDDVKLYQSRATMVSSNRLFEMFSYGVEKRAVKALESTDGYSFITEENVEEITMKKVNVAPEFIIVDFDYALSMDEDEKAAELVYLTPRYENALQKGIYVTHTDGIEYLYKRVVRSASQTRTGKAYFTRLDVNMVRKHATFGAFFLTRTGEQNLAKLEARIGLATSSTMKLDDEFTFDVLPDHEVIRNHTRIIVGSKLEDGKRVLDITKPVQSPEKYNYADGQGFVRPRTAARWALEARIINFAEFTEIMITLDLYDEDLVAIHDLHDEEFNRVWGKVPSAFQVRYGLCKGLLVVFPFHLEQYRQDCNKKTYREKGLVMEYWNASGDVDADGKHHYDFDVDVMFTDSMWKENFDPAYLTHKEKKFRPKMELVLWNGTAKQQVFMGYQFWQALGSKVSIRSFSREVLTNLKETIFTDAKQALLFLGTIDSGLYEDRDEEGNVVNEDGYLDHLLAQNSSIAKIQYTLLQNPSMINDRYVKQTLRKVIKRFVERMRDDARVPVEGANPYIIADPMPCFGLAPVLKAKQNYYNNMSCEAGGFRSPLVDESEAVVLQLNKKKAFRGLFKNIIVVNWSDDTLPRMGGADTDGDKIALVFDARIIKHIKTGLPMIVDAGEEGKKSIMSEENIAEYDLKTILPEAHGGEKVYGIGECTNFSTIWKDIEMSPNMMSMLTLSEAETKLNVKKLRGIQGISIDFAKTGVNVPVEESLIVYMQPAWKKGLALTKHLRDDEGNIKVYVSESQMQLNWNYVDKVLNNFEEFGEDASDGSGYTFMKKVNELDIVDFEEMKELTKAVSALESDYRNSMLRVGQFTDEDERMAYIVNTIEMFRFAVDSLPFPQATVSAVAYQLCYNTSSSKGKSLSFVWNCCFTGLARLMESTGNSLLLRSLRLPVDVCFAPKKISVFKQEFSFEYKSNKETFVANGSIAVPNGEYKVFVQNDRAFVEMKAGVAAGRKAEQIVRRAAEYVGKTIIATLTGIKYTDYTAVDFVNALQANGGLVQIVDGNRSSKDGGKKGALTVQIDGKTYGIIADKNSGEFLPIIGKCATFQVLDYMNLSGSYKKDDEVKTHTAMVLPFFFKGVDVVADEIDEVIESAQGHDDNGYNDYGYGMDTGIPAYMVEDKSFDIEDEEIEEEKEENYMKVNYSELLAVAPKKYSDDVSEMYSQVVGFDIERNDDIMNILIYREKGGVIAPAVATIKVAKNGQMKFADGETIKFNGKTIAVGGKFTTLVMQIAKFAKSL